MGRTGLRPHLGYMGVPRVAPRNIPPPARSPLASAELKCRRLAAWRWSEWHSRRRSAGGRRGRRHVGQDGSRLRSRLGGGEVGLSAKWAGPSAMWAVLLTTLVWGCRRRGRGRRRCGRGS
jgi:hypothetical protein